MKKILIGVVAVIVLGAAGFFAYRYFSKTPAYVPNGNPMASTAPAGTDWKYEKAIAAPITQKVATTNEATLGDLAKDQSTVVISKGALDSDMDVKLSTPDSVPKYAGEEVNMIGSPIEISVGQPVRLNDKATVTFKIPADQIPSTGDLDRLRVAYYDGTSWEYLKPLNIDLQAGTVTFDTYHFSLFGLTKIKDKTKLTEDWIHSKTLDDTLKENINEVTNEIGKKAVDMTLEKMGIKDPSWGVKVMADMLKDDGYKGLYDQYQKGDVEGFNAKLQLLIGKKISKNVPESVFKEALDGVLENKDDIVAVSKAAGYIAGGDYEGAAKLIGETISDKFLITTAGKIAVEVIDHEITTWKNDEVEAAFQAYKNGANSKFFGYNVDKGDFDAVWTQMRGVGRQLSIEAIAQENATRHDSGMPPLTPAQEDKVRQEVKDAYQAQFKQRMDSEDSMTAEQLKLKKIMDAMDKAGFLDEVTAPPGMGSSLDTTGRLDVLSHFVDKMMKDTNRFDLTDATGMIADKALNVDDLVQGARFFFGPDGKAQYQKFLKDRWNINSYPDLKDMGGKWSGSMTITNVVIPPELKSQPKGKTDENGCDFNIDLSQIIGKSFPIELTLTPNGAAAGSIVFSAKSGSPTTIPFTYTDGVIKMSLNQKGAIATITLTVTEDAKNYTAAGPLDVSYADGKVKITGAITTTKPIPLPAPAKK